MRSRTFLAFSAILLGSALGSAHGCSSGANADTGGGGAGTCPPVTCVTQPAAPTLLTSYADLLATLKSGVRVRAVLDYGKCTISGSPGPKALGAMNLDTFEWFDQGVLGNSKPYLAASETHLIKLPSGFVNDYVRVKVMSDDKVQIEVKYLDPQTYAVSVDELIDCAISDGTNAAGAAFYKMP
jgi:hypothetical protein